MRRLNELMRRVAVGVGGAILSLILSRVGIKFILWLARLQYGLSIVGADHLPRTGGCVVIGPLSSLLDALGLLFVMSRRQDLHGFGTCRWVTRSPQPGIATTWAHVALQWLQQGHAVAVPPEGGFRWDGRAQTVHPGAAWLALHAHVPVVVVILRGGYDIWPRWASHPKLTGKLTLLVGKPFYLAEGPQARVTAAMLRAASETIACAMARLEHHDP